MLSKPTTKCWSESNSASLHQTQGASELKRRTLDRLPTIGNQPQARYQASDTLIAFLTDR